MSYQRLNDRAWDAIRDVNIIPRFISNADGSCLIECGKTRVICTASVEEKVPAFLENSGLGWLTAEYNMLPGSAAGGRMSREKVMGAGRTQEIQRLIGRSLRASLDRKRLGLRQITVDCDVIEADGGTRTASVTGGYVAMVLAIRKLMQKGAISEDPVIHQVAAVSLGMVRGEMLLDLNFVEDSSADVDCNLVATSDGAVIEFQTTSERELLAPDNLQAMYHLGFSGIQTLCGLQNRALGL